MKAMIQGVEAAIQLSHENERKRKEQCAIQAIRKDPKQF